MSNENVEIVRAAYDAWNRGDMEAVREAYHPDAILCALESWPEAGPPVVGREAVIETFAQMKATWDTDSMQAISLIDAGDSVVVRTMWRGVGHGPDLNMELTIVFTLRKGKIFLLELFWNHAEALEAIGLSEHASN
jgi:ketosteroid isomerase-like protein